MHRRVKRCIEAGLADINEDCSSDEEQPAPEDFIPTLESRTGWKDFEEVNTTLPLSLENIHDYFVTTRLKRDDVTASKPFEKGYLFHARKVKSVAVHHVSTDSFYSVVRACVMASQRHDRMYETSVAIHKNLGKVMYGYCTCVAGKCSACNHVAALLFYIDGYNRTPGTQHTHSCTSLPCQWKRPSTSKSSPQKVSELKIEKPRIGHTTKESEKFEPLDRIRGFVSLDRVMRLREDLSASHVGTLGFHQVWPETVDVRQEAQLADQLSRWHATHSSNN